MHADSFHWERRSACVPLNGNSSDSRWTCDSPCGDRVHVAVTPWSRGTRPLFTREKSRDIWQRKREVEALEKEEGGTLLFFPSSLSCRAPLNRSLIAARRAANSRYCKSRLVFVPAVEARMFVLLADFLNRLFNRIIKFQKWCARVRAYTLLISMINCGIYVSM